MAEYNINKGIGQSVEFKGLKAQYLFIFAGGLLAVFFALNRHYGEHGLMKRMANRQHPRFLINRRKPYLIIKNKCNDNEEYAESNDY